MVEAVDLLRELATKLGTTVEALWPNVVRYIAIDAICSVCISLGALLISYIPVYLTRHKSWKEDDKKVAFTMIFIIVLIVVLGTLSINLPIIFEPTGYLVNNILRSI